MNTNKKITDGKLQILYRYGQPHCIRDRGGLLFSFRKISKYTGQDERYREEIEQSYRLADFLLRKLRMEQEGVTEQDIQETMPPSATMPHTRNG